MADMNKIRERSEIPVEDTWATEDLYATDAAWEEELATIEEDKNALAGYAGRLSESGKVLYDYLYRMEMTDEKASLLANYCMRKSDEDTRNAAYQAMTGKTLKENKMGEFGKISKGIVDKMMSDPNKTDDGYKVNVGIRRQDGDGLVVIGFTDDSYENVTGENLAASISKNVIIEKDGKILSTNFEPAKDSESIEAFEKKAKDAGYTFDGKRYETKKGEADVYTVMVAVSEAANSNTTAIVIIVIANAALILIGVCLYLVGAKKK